MPLNKCLCVFFAIVAVVTFFMKHEVMFINAVLITLLKKLFGQCISGLPVSLHNISISFHYFQIADSNNAVSVAVCNLFWELSNSVPTSTHPHSLPFTPTHPDPPKLMS